MATNGDLSAGDPEVKSFAEVVVASPPAPDEGVSKNEGKPTNGDMPLAVPGDNTYAEAVIEPPSKANGDTDHGDSSTASAVQPPAPGEHTGTGLDNPPRDHIRSKHRKTGSRGSSKSNGISKTKPSSSTSSESSVLDANGYNLVFEKYDDGEGGRLTSVKPPDDYEQNLIQGENEKRPDTSTKGGLDLVSGRQAAAGWERSGIRWAPLNVPLKRRLQTLTVLLHNLSLVTTLTLFLFLCAIPLLWPLIVPYLIYVLFSDAGSSGTFSHRSPYLRSLKLWSLLASYFPARLHRTEELPATRKYVFGYHPHGIISHGAFAAFCTEALGFAQLFPGITNALLTLDSNFRIPLYRDYMLAMGLASVSRESCENLLNKGGLDGSGMGRAITIVIGGARESLETQPGTLRLVLGRRKGFVKLAIRTGADLVPVLGFGENDIYEQLSPRHHPWLHRFQLLLKKVLGFTLPVFHARGIFNYDVGMMPYRRPINVVVGRPVKVVKCREGERPDEAYVEEIHAAYVRELRRIWDNYKDMFAKERISELEIVE